MGIARGGTLSYPMECLRFSARSMKLTPVRRGEGSTRGDDKTQKFSQALALFIVGWRFDTGFTKAPKHRIPPR